MVDYDYRYGPHQKRLTEYDQEGKMKTKGLCYRIAVVSFLILGIGTTAAAQRRGRDWNGYPNWGGSYDLRQTALNAGFNEGSKEGSRERARNRRSNYEDFG